MDQTRDLSGQKLYRLCQLVTPPEFVKRASVEDLCGSTDMAPELYADPVHRLFPCHSPAATWTSTLYFLDKKAEFKPDEAILIEDRINYYTGFHRIENSVDTLRKNFTQTEKQASDNLTDEDYALVLTNADGTNKTRHYPLRNSQEVKTAAEYLAKNRDFFNYNIRRDFADKVMQKAAATGTDLGEHTDFIEKQAGYGSCLTKEAVDMLRDRVYATRGPGAQLSEAQQSVMDLANTFEQSPSKLRAPGVLVKLASVVDDFDRIHGLHKQYGEEFKRPEDVLFDLTREKMASVVKDHVANPQTGTIYSIADLEQVKMADVRNYLGDDFADAVAGSNKLNIDSEKAADIIPTMDRGFAELFDSFMNEHGIKPIAKGASAEALTHSRAYLLELADSFKKSTAIKSSSRI